MGSLDVERKTRGLAATDPSGILSPYTYTLRSASNSNLTNYSLCDLFFSPLMTDLIWLFCIGTGSLTGVQALKMYLSKWFAVGFAILIFIKSKIILACPIIPWFQGTYLLSLFVCYILHLYISRIMLAFKTTGH